MLNHTAAQQSGQTDPTGEQKKSHPYAIRHIKIKDPEYISEVPEHLRNKDIPGFPSTIVAVGRPGSGKTNVLANLLLDPKFWFRFYDKIYLIGPTVETDKLYQEMKVPDDQIVTDPDEMIPKVMEWTKAQIEAVKANPETAPKCLFVFEDITSYKDTVQRNPNFVKCFTTIRHHKATAYANIHKYKALERTCRVSCMHILVWPVNTTDIDMIYEEYGTSEISKKDFHYMCKYAWTKDENNEKPFLYINLYAELSKRFRKCFTDIIDVQHFKGMAKRETLLEKEKNKRLVSGKSPDNLESKAPKADGDLTKGLLPEAKENKKQSPQSGKPIAQNSNQVEGASLAIPKSNKPPISLTNNIGYIK